MGYTRVRHYVGGILEWTESGAPVEKGEVETDANGNGEKAGGHRPPLHAHRHGSPVDRFIHYLGDSSFGSLLSIWVGLVVVCAIIYTVADSVAPGSLLEHERALAGGPSGFPSALYFSFVTATSV